MQLGVNFAKLTWAGGAAHLGATASEAIVLADEAGFSTVSAMDHFFQIPIVGQVDEPMVDGYTFLGFAAALTSRRPAQVDGHRRHLPPSRSAGEDRDHARRVVVGTRRARDRRRVVRP